EPYTDEPYARKRAGGMHSACPACLPQGPRSGPGRVPAALCPGPSESNRGTRGGTPSLSLDRAGGESFNNPGRPQPKDDNQGQDTDGRSQQQRSPVRGDEPLQRAQGDGQRVRLPLL